MHKVKILLSLLLLMLVPVTNLLAATQTIKVGLGSQSVGAGDSFVASVMYSADDKTNGIDLSIHFDSSALTFVGIEEGSLFEDPITPSFPVQSDVDDKDNDPTTDSFVQISWLKMGWDPEGEIKLVGFDFQVKNNTYKESTKLNLSYTPAGETVVPIGNTLQISGIKTDIILTANPESGSVAGSKILLLAAFQANDVQVNATNATLFSFSTTGNGTFDKKTVKDGKVQIEYTTPKTVETASITATEKFTGSDKNATISIASVSGPANSVAINSGNNQTGTVGVNLGNLLVVKVVDANNNPVAGEDVTFSVTNGGGSVDPATDTTDASGLASTVLTLGQKVADNPNTVNASCSVGSQIFTATAVPGSLDDFDIQKDDSFTAGTKPTLKLTALDQYDNVITNYDGTVTVVVDGQSVSKEFNATSDNGTTQVELAPLTGSGDYEVSVKVGDEEIQTSTITVAHAAAAKLELVAKNGKTTLASGGSQETLKVSIFDSYNNTVDNATNTINFNVSNATYVDLSAAAVNATAGVAEVTITTKDDEIKNAPVYVNATCSAVGLGNDSVEFKLVNFTIDPVSPALVGGVMRLLPKGNATFRGVGGTSGNYRWYLNGGSDPVSSDEKYDYTAPETITGATENATITLTDASDASLTATFTIQLYNPLKIMVGGEDKTNGEIYVPNIAGKNTATIDITGGLAPYSWDLNATAGSLGAGTTSRVFTATVNATGNNTLTISADTDPSLFNATLDIHVVSFAVTGDQYILTNTAKKYTAQGAVGTVAWTLNGEAVDPSDDRLSGDKKEVFTLTAQATGAYALVATDGDTGVSSTFDVTAYNPIAVNEDDDIASGWLIIDPNSETNAASFTVTGGDADALTWTVDRPGDCAFVVDKTTATFTAKNTGDFAGAFNITVTDDKANTGGTTYTLYVKLGPITQDKYIVPEDQNATFSVTGASTGIGWSVIDGEGDDISATTGSVSGNGNATTFVPADVDAITSFYVRAEKDNLNATERISALTKVVPVEDFTVKVTGPDGEALNGTEADVCVVRGDDEDCAATVNGTVIFTLPATGGSYEYRAMAQSNTYAPAILTSKEPLVEIELQKAGYVLNGTVTDASNGTGIGDASVRVTNGEKSFETETDASGAYLVPLPGTTEQTAGYWTVDVFHEVYGSNATTIDSNVNATFDPTLARKTRAWAWGAVNNGIVEISVEADPEFSSAGDADLTGTAPVKNATFDTTEKVITFYCNATTSFNATIAGNGTVAGWPGFSLNYAHDANSTAKANGGFNAVKGEAALGGLEANGQEIVVLVAPGGIDEDGNFTIAQYESDNTAVDGSGGYVYEVNTTVAKDKIKRLEITLPIDLSKVDPGDFENKIRVIRYAADVPTLGTNNAKTVPVANIINTDYVGNGKIGSVTFWVDHLTVFGVGLPVASSGGGGDDNHGCVMNPNASLDISLVVLLLGMIVLRGYGVMRRRRNR
jgi:hypothetical protein